MKKSYLVFLVLTCGLLAQSTKIGGSGTTKVGGSGVSKVSPVVAAATYLLQQDFTTGSGTTPPSGWTVPPGGTYSYSNTSPSLPQGGNNYTISTGIDTFETWASYTGQTECWGYFQFQIASIPAAAKVIFTLEDSGGTAKCFIKINLDGTLQIWDDSFEADATTGTLSANTNYQIWVHFKSGVSMDVGFSTSGTRPTSGPNFVLKTGISTSATVSRVGLMGNDVSISQYWDHILINNSQIGDSP